MMADDILEFELEGCGFGHVQFLMRILKGLGFFSVGRYITEILSMSKNTDKVFYAVGRGKEIGIYDSWNECKAQTEGIVNAKFRKFYSLEEAEEFVNFWKNYSSSEKELIKSENLVELKESDRSSEETKDFQTQPTNELTSQQSYNVHLKPPSPHLNAFEGKIDQRNVDLMLLNLRFDSFEKRFDNALKEIGAISAEISNLKSEIRELKEISGSISGYRGTPKKKNDGMLQTTLPFGSNSTSPSWSSPAKDSPSSEENKTKGRSLKRKLSKTFSAECSKRFADDSGDFEDIINRVKVEAIDIDSFKYDEDDYVEVYTDGSVRANGQMNAKAGIGIWFGDNHPLNVAEAVIGSPTNNTAEIQAARVAVQLAIKAGIKKLKILTDSEFLINCATKWIHRWKKNGWTLRDGGPVKHRKELEKLDKIASEISVRWEKVAGHSGVKGNETADRLANAGAVKYNS